LNKDFNDRKGRSGWAAYHIKSFTIKIKRFKKGKTEILSIKKRNTIGRDPMEKLGDIFTFIALRDR